MQVKWLDKALDNLDEEMEYIAREDSDAANQAFKHVMEQVNSLAQFPHKGRPGRVAGTRELVIQKYPFLVPYTIEYGCVVIIRVFHTSRQLPDTW